MVGYSRRLLQRRVGSNHLARYEIFADAEVLQRTLRLSTPEFFGGDIDFAEAVGFLSNAAGVRAHVHYLFLPQRLNFQWEISLSISPRVKNSRNDHSPDVRL